MRIIIGVVLMILALSPLLGQGCSNTQLQRVQAFASINAGIDVCTTPAQTVKTNLKFMFVVDRSGSNSKDIATDGFGNVVYSLCNNAAHQPVPCVPVPAVCPGSTTAPLAAASGTYCPIINFATQAPIPISGTDPITCPGLGVSPADTSPACESRRFTPIMQMAQTYAADPNAASIFWNLITFESSATIAFPPNNGDPNWLTTPIFSNKNQNPNLSPTRVLNGTYFQDAIINQEHDAEGNFTNYLDALQQMQNVIQIDIAQAQAAAQLNGTTPVGSTYVIFFITDGAPWIQDPTGSSPFGVLQPTNQIQAAINGLSALMTQYPDYVDNITINTAYYYQGGPPAPGAVYDPKVMDYDATGDTLLSNMSSWGGGRFLNFGAGQAVDISRFQVPTRIAKYTLNDLWVKDINTVWWNGQLMKDSDADGLPDSIELQYGSDPNNPDSDGDGVSDGVWFNQHQQPCQNTSCAVVADPPPSCSVGNFNWTTRKFPDTDNDGLNDCEEQLLGSSPTNFDSNSDKVPDYIEYISNAAFTLQQGINLNNNPAGDGISNYLKMKQNYPIETNINSIPGLQPLVLARTQVSDNASQTCYHYNVQNLSTASPNDTVRVMMVQEQVGVGSKPTLRVGQKQLINGTVQFVDSDIK